MRLPRPSHFRLVLALAAPSIPALLTGCGTGAAASPPAPDAGTDGAIPVADGGGDSATSDAAASDSGAPPEDTGAPVAVTFAYTPQWDGVKKIEVIGGFGASSDWSKTASLVTLAAPGGAGGAWTGSAMLPPGTYLYLFRVTGDAASSTPATYERYAVDPLDEAFAPCPAESPSYSKIDVNPCSQLTVTASGGPAAAAPVHVKGTVHVDGSPAAG
jgi:hypothetical protein